MRILSFCLVLMLFGCTNNPVPIPTATLPSATEMADITPESFATQTPLPVITSVPTATPAPTNTPAPSPTYTFTPSPTETPTPKLPTSPMIFQADGKLQQWWPENGKIETLTENISGRLKYSQNIVTFFREHKESQEVALIAYHIPSRSETELLKIDGLLSNPDIALPERISISPDGNRIIYVIEESNQQFALTTHSLVFENRQLIVSDPTSVKTFNIIEWENYYHRFMWATNDKLSWSDQHDIWIVDLASSSMEPFITIPRSTNTFEGPNEEITGRQYIPYEWSPDGKYLIVVETFYEGGSFVVIKNGGQRSFQIPDSQDGVIPDALMWLDEDRFVHFQTWGTVNVWQVPAEQGNKMILESSTEFSPGDVIEYFSVDDSHVRFSQSSVARTSSAMLYNFNFDTGEYKAISQDYGKYPRHSSEGWSPVMTAWSPDKQFALVKLKLEESEAGRKTQLFILDFLDGETALDVSHLFETDLCCWYWYEGDEQILVEQ